MIGLVLPLIARLGVPERFQRAAAWAALIVTAIALLGLGKWLYDRSVIRDYERGATAQASASASAAAIKATEAVTETTNRVEAGNEQARNAANRGDDYLGDGLRSLRAAKTQGSPAPR